MNKNAYSKPISTYNQLSQSKCKNIRVGCKRRNFNILWKVEDEGRGFLPPYRLFGLHDCVRPQVRPFHGQKGWPRSINNSLFEVEPLRYRFSV